MKLILPAFLFLSIAFSCKKQDNCEGVNNNTILGTYKLKAMLIKITGEEERDEISLRPCLLDNLYTFKSDSTFDFVDPHPKCPGTPDYTDSWELLLNGEAILLGTSYHQITSFDCKTLNLHYSYGGLSVKMTLVK